MRLRSIAALLAFSLATTDGALAQGVAEPAEEEVIEEVEEEIDPATRPLWRLELALEGLYDSNVNFSSAEVDSTGLQGAAIVRYQNRKSWPTFHARYGIAEQWYEATDRWNRTSHDLRLSHIVRSSDRRFRLETVGQVQIKGWTVDRELADLYIFAPRLDYRPNRDHRIRFLAAARNKQFEPEDPDPENGSGAEGRDAFSPYGEIEYRRYLKSDHYWAVRTRFERNDADDERFSYDRTTLTVIYLIPLGDAASLRFRTDYREREWDTRTGRSGGQRVDERWTPSIRASRSFAERYTLDLEYRYDRQSSNAPNRDFGRHRVALINRWRW